MIKIIMASGEEYNVKRENLDWLFNDFISTETILPNRLFYLGENVYINLSQISSIEHKSYISDSDVIVP